MEKQKVTTSSRGVRALTKKNQSLSNDENKRAQNMKAKPRKIIIINDNSRKNKMRLIASATSGYSSQTENTNKYNESTKRSRNNLFKFYTFLITYTYN